ncbi:solute-binding protein [Nitrogeniibacter mangrovi]|uniref:Solute-binding protein n=1 Tax=Nitrogeniibacter mangrovi TaxID=2016596 RepID=A0A6C1B4J8_9RHOO|nr:substrate-binding domain-containing protein [Nitrogeniibacter mangrovi]QID18611.1 solute-binding protein [Nitrogeniibacter mangrovi]
MARRFLSRLTAALLIGAAAIGAQAGESIIVASTTSTQNSGLFDYILPIFEKETGIGVKVIAQGTGKALDTGRRGDADVLLVHDRVKEDKFVEEGYGAYRKNVMYNDFVIVGPKSDPAGIKGDKSATDAFTKIADSGSPFASRADKSGTNAAEKRFWVATGKGVPEGKDWYKETGSGMGATLNTAAGMDAYTLTDRGSWANFKNRQNLEILVEGDPKLYNPYGVILVNPKKHPHVKVEAGEKFIHWITSDAGHKVISSYKLHGEQLFFPLKAE